MPTAVTVLIVAQPVVYALLCNKLKFCSCCFSSPIDIVDVIGSPLRMLCCSESEWWRVVLHCNRFCLEIVVSA